MGFWQILLLGVGLSMDALAVTLANAMALPGMTRSQKLSMPVLFGIFQALMPVIGFYAGSLFAGVLERIAGPFTLVVLAVLGANMIREAVRELRSTPEEAASSAYSVKLIVLQAVATSIDALVVGVSFAAHSDFAIAPAALLIGCTTFVICLAATAVGSSLGERFGSRAKVVGGCILILIGVLALLP